MISSWTGSWTGARSALRTEPLSPITPYLGVEECPYAKEGETIRYVVTIEMVSLIYSLRHFAQGEIKAFVVALLLHSSVEVDVESDRWPEPTLEKVGSGVFGPKGDVNVIIRKHKLWPSP